MILRTERLLLREMGPDDFEALARMLLDPAVMYAYGGAFDEAMARDWLERQLRRYREDGFGLWAVLLKATGDRIGQCGLTWQDFEGRRVLEVGYLFEKAHWHKGYATEAARACKTYAFETLGAREVYSIIRDTNLPSQRVARNNGMEICGRFVKRYRGEDMPHLAFVARREG